jgi:hypothetical protein
MFTTGAQSHRGKPQRFSGLLFILILPSCPFLER